MINIINKHTSPNIPHIYCGRGSALGNPFKIGPDGSRDDVCDKYQEYFDEKLKEDPNTIFNSTLRHLTDLAAHGDINLGCYCAPMRCHCNTIKNHIDSRLADEYDSKLSKSNEILF